MKTADLTLTYLNGATALIEFEGLRFLTDPTFDPAGSDYALAGYSLHKTSESALAPQSLPAIDAVLLSHDHHIDNLDHSGREVASRARHVLTTTAGAARLGAPARGMNPGETFTLPGPDGRAVEIIATPARHGPEGGDRGPVIGFVLRSTAERDRCAYISGDTVWYPEVEKVARSYPVKLAVLFMGAAKVAPAGPAPLTFTAAGAVEAARAFSGATIVPLHFEGWAHFTESRAEIADAFSAAGLSHRILWPERGRALRFPV